MVQPEKEVSSNGGGIFNHEQCVDLNNEISDVGCCTFEIYIFFYKYLN